MRNCKHEKKIVLMEIGKKGIEVFPDKHVSLEN